MASAGHFFFLIIKDTSQENNYHKWTLHMQNRQGPNLISGPGAGSG